MMYTIAINTMHHLLMYQKRSHAAYTAITGICKSSIICDERQLYYEFNIPSLVYHMFHIKALKYYIYLG